jgi:hypothetical protein
MRCKFVFSYIQPYEIEKGKFGYTLQFNVVYSGSEENKKFFALTPGGQLSFFTVNEDVAKKLQLGKEYYIDISEANVEF